MLDTRRADGEAIIAVESEAIIDIDPLNRPISFTSITRIGPSGNEAPHRSLMAGVEFNVAMRGKVEGDVMHIAILAGELEYHTDIDLPPDALIGDVLSPQTRLPGLRVGQTWTVPIYSPFRPPNSPVEILHATVERKDPIFWHDQIVPALLVVYRGDPGLGLTSNQAPRRADVGRLRRRGRQARDHAAFLAHDVRSADPQQPTPANLLPDTSEPLRVPPTGLEDLIQSEQAPEPTATTESNAGSDPSNVPETSAEPESSP